MDEHSWSNEGNVWERVVVILVTIVWEVVVTRVLMAVVRFGSDALLVVDIVL